MEQLTEVIAIRITKAEYELLKSEASEKVRPIGWIAREKLRKAMN